VGVYNLGPKISGIPYKPDEVQLLSVLGKQAAVSVENARLYREIASYSHTLEQQVAARTQQLGQKNIQLEQEITGRQSAETDRAATMHLMQTTLDGMADPVVLIGTDYQVLWANRVMRENYTGPDQDTPWHCYQLSHGRDKPCDSATCTCALRTVQAEMKPITVRHEHIQADGSVRFLEIVASPLVDTEGTLTGIVEATRDITDRIRVEQKLSASEERLAKAQKAAKVGHYEWDLSANTTLWSAELYHIFGLDPATYTPNAETFNELVHPEDLDLLSAENVTRLTPIEFHELEFRVIDQTSGAIKHIHLWGETTFNADGAPSNIFGIIQDVTDQKSAEAAVLQLAAIEERHRLARDLHDSMTQSVSSMVLIAENALYLHQEKRLEPMAASLQILVETSLQMLREMRLLLFELNLTPDQQVDLFEILATRLETVEQRLGLKTELHIDGVGNLSKVMQEEIFYIAFEALNNTLKHSQADQVTVTLQGNMHDIKLEIGDNGLGFDPVRMEDCGMGLTNMRARATQIGGQLTIDSQVGAGTRVKLAIIRNDRKSD
jgi:PAS domain S-box-containing protein